MTKILVTGGAGFIGGALVHKLLENKENFVVVTDLLTTGYLHNLPRNNTNLKFIKCDVNNFKSISSVFYAFSFDYVFHYAAVVGVKRTLENPLSVLHDIEGIDNVLSLSKDTGVKRVFYSSSSEVYGEPVELPQNEDTTPLNSKLPYAIVKNVGEAYLKAYKKEFNLDYTIFRFFNTYGPRQTSDFVMRKFITLALKNSDIPIYGTGEQTRTFCYIDDNIEATMNAFYGNLGLNDVFNVGNDNETAILHLAKLIIHETNSSSKIIFQAPLPEGDMTRRKPDIAKMKILLNRELLPLVEGIRMVIKSVKENHKG
ncbi:MAG: epimerase [Bacteroidetes bacterium RIFCSPLOWO2_02_FULL_36_8]|nr:MAG: epimerase [Bacteroidetes bacterium RIFCSPLOWO2_02_FULL_36_8]OFY70264.1 MAG: epimerase [Bacteroidetes bacterium RIFCSPLOWO2_12_FULL_37_12]